MGLAAFNKMQATLKKHKKKNGNTSGPSSNSSNQSHSFSSSESISISDEDSSGRMSDDHSNDEEREDEKIFLYTTKHIGSAELIYEQIIQYLDRKKAKKLKEDQMPSQSLKRIGTFMPQQPLMLDSKNWAHLDSEESQ